MGGMRKVFDRIKIFTDIDKGDSITVIVPINEGEGKWCKGYITDVDEFT
jgi:hypothetical protein